MFIKKRKPSLEVYQSTFYKFIFLILFFFVFSCRTPVYKNTYCQENKNIHKILQSINIDSNKWILVSLNISNRDYKNEIIHDTRLIMAELKGEELFFKDIKIIGRDDYPFKPISFAYDEKSKTFYLLNIAFNLQRSIEIYSLKEDTLIFKNRYRSKTFQNLLSITFWKDKLIALNYLDNFLAIDPTIFYELKNEQFQSIKSKITKAERIKKIHNELYAFIPENKEIVQLDDQYNIIKRIQFDLYPYDMFFYNNKFIVLLNKKYIHIYKSYEQDNFINNPSFVYSIPEKSIAQDRKFKLTDTDFEKYLINNHPYFDLFYFSIPKKNSIEIILNQYTIYSNRCSITSDLDR
jgi:hypothetical protein